jgi:hypothetical protein
MDTFCCSIDVEGLDDKDNQNIQVKKLGIINIRGFMTMNVDIHNTNEDSDIINKLEISLAPMEKTLS